MAVPGVIKALVDAARRRDLGAMHGLIDWEASTYAVLNDALASLEPRLRAEASRRGLADAARTFSDPGHVESVLLELALDLNDPQLSVRPASDRDAADAFGAVQIGAIPEGVSAEVEHILLEMRARAKTVQNAWIIGREFPGRKYPVLINSSGTGVILVPERRFGRNSAQDRAKTLAQP